MTPYGNIDLSQHWLRWWLVAWKHQTIVYTHVDWPSVRSGVSYIHRGQASFFRPCLDCWHLTWLGTVTHHGHKSHGNNVGFWLGKDQCLHPVTQGNWSIPTIPSLGDFQVTYLCLDIQLSHISSCLQYLTHLPLDKMAAISQATFSDAFLWMKSFVYWLKFHWSLFLGFELPIFQHWFR